MVGELRHHDGRLLLCATAIRPAVLLLPLRPTDKLQWSHTARTRKRLSPSEANAYQQLADEHKEPPQPHRVAVTGPLTQTPQGYELRVRVVEPT